MKKLLLGSFILIGGIVFGQDQIQFSAANDGLTLPVGGTCNGFIIDSGGPGGPGYSNNEDVTITVCPTAGSDEIVSATFNLFDLTSGAACNTGTNQNPIFDYMTIYDGDSDAAPTLGTYTGTDLANTTVQATTLNTSGCLTFRFQSNSVCTGNFTASVTCTTPCQNPVAAGVILNGDAPDSIAACVGEVIDFQELGSFAQPGFNLASYMWDFRDGSTAMGQNASHAYSQPGEYKVLLFVTDDNTNTPDGEPCQNLNLTELQVLVGIPPSFEDFPVDTSLCIGEQLELTASPSLWDTTWTGFPGTNAVDDGCLYDTLLGVAQTIPLFQGGFAPGQTIDDPAMFESICLDMEHSYMGDLVIQIKCPNGSIVTLHQQGGGGTQIGEPIDNGNDPVNCETGANQGVPYQYCWNSTATDTWVEWVDAQGGFGLTLPAGDYEPVESLNGLIGCPLNGVWELIVTDNWAADDGTVFGFGLNFDPALYPPVTEFSNVSGEGADSSFWQPGGAFVTSTSADGNIINIEPTTEGTYTYTFSVTDNFGCTNDSTVTVVVEPPLNADAGPDIVVCDGDPTVIGTPAPQCDNDGGPFDICYDNNWTNQTFTYCPDNPGDGITFMTFAIANGGFEPNYDDITIYDGNSTSAPVLAGPLDGDLSGQSWTATNATGCITISINSDGSVSCASGSTSYGIQGEVTCGGPMGITYQWSPNDGTLDDINIPNPTVTSNGSQTYELTIFPTGHPLCAVTDQMQVTISNSGDAGTDGTLDICSDGTPVDLFTQLGGTPDAGGVWKNPSGTVVAMPYDPNTFDPGVYTYELDINGCVTTSTVTVTEFTIASTSVSSDADCGTACNGEVTITPSGGQGNYQFSSDNGNVFQASGTFTGLCPGSYSILVQDDLGCQHTATRVIGEINHPTIESVVPTNVTCYGANDGTVTINTTNVVNYSLDAGNTTQTSENFTDLAPGTYVIQVDNGFGCNVNANLTINQPDSLHFLVFSEDLTQCPETPVWAHSNVQGGSSPYIYNWTLNGQSVSNEPDLQLPTSPVGGGVYCLSVTEECGSTQIDTCFILRNHPDVNPLIRDSVKGCYPVEATFDNVSGNVGDIAQVEWDFGDGSTGTTFTNTSASHTYQDPGVYDVYVKVTSIHGCIYDTIFENYARVFDYPNANFVNSPSSPSMYNANTEFEELASPDVVTWEWDFGPQATPSTSNERTPKVVYPDGQYGTYPATLWVTNADGCRDSITYNIIVQSEVLIYAPNTFTPDGDEYNEEWKVVMEGIDVYDFDLFIYNRWGEIVWESHDVSVGWNGKYQNRPVPDGTYVWVIRTKDLENDEKYTFKGFVNVLR